LPEASFVVKLKVGFEKRTAQHCMQPILPPLRFGETADAGVGRRRVREVRVEK
jgi:hypothetical protein